MILYNFERKTKVVKDENKLHGTESTDNKSNVIIPLLCEKSGAIFLVLVGLTAASQTKYWYVVLKMLYRLHC